MKDWKKVNLAAYWLYSSFIGAHVEQSNPYSPPQASLDNPASDTDARIDALAVSDTWKRRFRAIAKAGGPALPHVKTMSKEERKDLSPFNILAFLFGPFYYLAKGMWKKALAMGGACIAAVLVFQMVMLMLGLESLARASGFAVGAVFAVRANLDFYKKMVLGDDSWW
jgi:hypothetical protein